MTRKRPPRRRARARRAEISKPRPVVRPPPRRPSAGTSRDVALERVRRALLDVLPDKTPRQLARNASLVRDLGVDSLKTAELSLSLERHFGRPIFVGELFADVDDPRTLTVGDVAELLSRTP